VTRGSAPTGPIRPQFRCPVCKEFVHGTESGHCPRCGRASVTAEVLPRDRTRSHLVGLLAALVAAAVAAWLVVRH
jgi:uncharacterized paraquat-inducible protein A